MKPLEKKFALILVGSLIFSGGLLAFLTRPSTVLPGYLKAATRMQKGEMIHRNNEDAFAYPALLALPFVPFTWVPSELHRPLWYLVNVAALVVIGWRLWARLRPMVAVRHLSTEASSVGRIPKRPGVPLWLFAALLLLFTGRHILAPLEIHSHDVLLLLCVVLAIDAGCAAREKTAGLMAGLGAALKLTPGLFAPVFFWQRRFTAFLTLLLAFVAFTFLPDLLYSARDGNPWIVTWYQKFLCHVELGETATAEGAWGYNIYNQSLPGTFCRLFQHQPIDACIVELSTPARKGATLAAQLAVLAWLWWITRPALAFNLPAGEIVLQRLGQGGAILLGMMLLSPTSIHTHFCGMIVPTAFCLADFLYRRRDWLVGCLLVMVFLLETLRWRFAMSALLDDYQSSLVLAYGSITWGGLIMLLASGRILLQRAAAFRAERFPEGSSGKVVAFSVIFPMAENKTDRIGKAQGVGVQAD